MQRLVLAQERSQQHLHGCEMESPSSRHCKGMTAPSPEDYPTAGRFPRRLFRDWISYAEVRSPEEKEALLGRILSALDGGDVTNVIALSRDRSGCRRAKRRTCRRTGL